MFDRPVWFIGRRFFSAGSSSRLASFISLLAMTGLVMGVSLLIVVLSVMNGFDREMRTRILGLVPHIQLFQRGGVDNWQALEDEIRRIPGVAEVTPFSRLTAML
ncbi:MAG: ABC transporter permease, partial [Porticoccaceae bacterium]